MKKFSAVLLGIVLFFVSAQGVSATTTPPLQRPLCTISAYPNSVRLGGTANLTWSSQYATGGTITSLGNVALYGSQGVIPTGEGTTYVGTFTGPGGTGTCSVRVSIILNDGGGGDIDTSGDDEIDTSGTINNAGTVDKAGTVNKPGTLGAPPVQNAAPIMPGGSGGAPGSSATNRLVPCDGIDCQACKLALLGQNIINFLVGISIPLAAVMFAYAGFIYFSSSVIDKIQKAHKIFTSVLIGFAIVIGGYLIVETILHTILNESYWKSWNQIQCVSQERKTNATIEELLKNLSVTNSGSTSVGGGGGGGGSGTCTNCEKINGDWQIKNNNQVDPAMNEALGRFGAELNGAGIQTSNLAITEAWPPTSTHQSNCHYTGTCIDLGLRGEYTYTSETISAIQEAARNAGMCAVYESPDPCNGRPQCLTGNYTPHFSIYNNTSCSGR